MCGIFALLCRNYQSKYNSTKLMRHMNAIKGRGPDNTHTLPINNNIFFGFHRLSINDLTSKGDQPFEFKEDGLYLQCNGEIYNHIKLENEYNIKTKSNSDCEVILHLYKKFGIQKTIKLLDGVFAFTIYDENNDVVYAGRDPIGVRPLFIGYDEENEGIFLSSESKSFIDYTKKVKQFEPGSYWCSNNPNEFIKYWELNNDDIRYTTEESALDMIRENFTNAVEKRLMSDRPIGAFLSGGLDSSLVCALAKQLNNGLNTYSVGMKGGTDLEKAKIAAEYIKSNHNEIIFTADEGINALENVIYTLETFDITTIRASVGMYILADWVSKNSDDIVIYSGEGSDEVTQGYLYFHKAPSAQDGAIDSLRLVNQLHWYDVKRVDRTVSCHGLEVRVPFLDKKFVKDYFSIAPELRTPKYKGIEKYLVRQAYNNMNLLPNEILWRTKEALSDGVSSKNESWYEILQKYINVRITDKELYDSQQYYKSINNIIPFNKEALYYRKIYEKYFGDIELIPHYWTQKWTKNPNAISARETEQYKGLMDNNENQFKKIKIDDY